MVGRSLCLAAPGGRCARGEQQVAAKVAVTNPSKNSPTGLSALSALSFSAFSAAAAANWLGLGLGLGLGVGVGVGAGLGLGVGLGLGFGFGFGGGHRSLGLPQLQRARPAADEAEEAAVVRGVVLGVVLGAVRGLRASGGEAAGGVRVGHGGVGLAQLPLEILELARGELAWHGGG